MITLKTIFNKNNHKLRPRSLVRGFTVIEIMIVLFILSVLTAIIFTSVSAFRSGKALQVVAEEILSLLDEGRGNTLAAKDSYAYGVHFESDSTTLFRGTSYSSSDLTNKKVDVDGAVEISSISLAGGGQDVLFQKLTGKTGQNGTVTIRLRSDNSKTKKIVIEASGVASSD